MPDVVMYSKSGCPYCDKAREYFQRAGIMVTETKVEDAVERQRLYARWAAEDRGGALPPPKSVPQIFIDGTRLGGFDALERERLAEHWSALAR